MKKDINYPKVSDVHVAAINFADGADPNFEHDWDIILINKNDLPLKDILITSKGYGIKDGEAVKTSILRKYFDDLGPGEYLTIEPIVPDVFGLTNEYWVSFYMEGLMYDKKFVFLPETIDKRNFTNIPVLNKPGVLLG